MTKVDGDVLTVLVLADDGAACDRLGDAVRSSLPCRVLCEHRPDLGEPVLDLDADVAVIDDSWLESPSLTIHGYSDGHSDLRTLARGLPVVVLSLPSVGAYMTPDNRRQLRDTVEAAVSDGGTRLYVLDGAPDIVPEPVEPEFNFLSDREMDVLGRMAAGYSNRDIALQMGLAHATVKFHVSNVLRKLEVRSRAHAVSLALRERIIRPGDVVRRMPPSA